MHAEGRCYTCCFRAFGVSSFSPHFHTEVTNSLSSRYNMIHILSNFISPSGNNNRDKQIDWRNDIHQLATVYAFCCSSLTIHVRHLLLLPTSVIKLCVVTLNSNNDLDSICILLPCDAMRCTVLVFNDSPGNVASFCPSVFRPSDTLVDCVHRVRPTIMISSPYGSPIILVSGDITYIQKFEGGHPDGGRWMRVGWVRIGYFRPISRRISETVRDTTKVTIDH